MSKIFQEFIEIVQADFKEYIFEHTLCLVVIVLLSAFQEYDLFLVGIGFYLVSFLKHYLKAVEIVTNKKSRWDWVPFSAWFILLIINIILIFKI